MKPGTKIRAALAVASLLAQLVLPVAHGLGVASDEVSTVSSGAAATIASPSHASTASAHDPSLCPACVALHQVRAGVSRTAPASTGLLIAGVVSLGREPVLVLPRAHDLVTAPPRAPPIRSLVFA